MQLLPHSFFSRQFMADQLPSPTPLAQRVWFWLILALAGPLALYVGFGWLSTSSVKGVRLFFDSYDPLVYYNASSWVANGGTLYRDVLSEYPPAATLIFAAVRYISETLRPFPSAFDSFVWAWMSTAWVVYLAIIRTTLNHLPPKMVWLWLNPVVLYFALQRFDIYPAGLTLLALIAASRDRYLTAALWLGLAASVKGYPLFVVPAFVLYVLKLAGFSRAIRACVICGGVFVAPICVVASYAGWDAATLPFLYHAARGLDPDEKSSTYHVAIEVLGIEQVRDLTANRTIPRVLQLATVLLAASLVPSRIDRIDQFALAGLLAVTGFMSFSLFFSPQFVIWLVPFAVYSNSRLILATVHATLVATWLFFPVAYDLKLANPGSAFNENLFDFAVLLMTVLRFVVMAASLGTLLARQGPNSVVLQR